MEKILLIDEDDGLIHFLRRFFQRKGYAVTACAGGPTALERIAAERFDLILLDDNVSGLSGLDILTRIKNQPIKTPVIMMTAHGATDIAIEAIKRGACDYLIKPIERKELSRVVSDALLLNTRMKQVVLVPGERLPTTKPSLGERLRIVGDSKPMHAVYKRIGQVAATDVSVLIGGESGTGKELVARAIYHHSRRREKIFMAINCAAIPEHLIESELFGYERGAFTGAERTYLGKLERCDGGTCFLDEIGDMSMAMQAKLLRVLQEGQFERLGGRGSIKVNVRLIAATNKDLAEMVRHGRFREDLYWRLKVIAIHLPPLRSRREDIPALANYYLARFSAEYAKPIRALTEPALARLGAHCWPGNVRELENCLRRAVLLCAGDVIADEHIEPLASCNDPSVQPAHRDALFKALKGKLEALAPDFLRLSESGIHANIIELVERTLIFQALEQCGQNQVKAARLLGISRNTLRHRLKKYLENQAQGGPDDTGPGWR